MNPPVRHMSQNPDATLTYAGLHCLHCGYDVQGLPEPRCPECGCEFNPTDLVIEKYRKPFNPAWLFVSAFFGFLVVWSSWSNGWTYATFRGRCGTGVCMA